MFSSPGWLVENMIWRSFLPFRVVGGYYTLLVDEYVISTHHPYLSLHPKAPRPWAFDTYSTVSAQLFPSVNVRPETSPIHTSCHVLAFSLSSPMLSYTLVWAMAYMTAGNIYRLMYYYGVNSLDYSGYVSAMSLCTGFLATWISHNFSAAVFLCAPTKCNCHG